MSVKRCFISVVLIVLGMCTLSAALADEELAKIHFPKDVNVESTTFRDISANGRWLLITARAEGTDIGGNAAKSPSGDLFLLDKTTDDIVQITVGVDGEPANSNVSGVSFIDNDTVLFLSTANNLTENSSDSTTKNIYTYQISTGELSVIALPDSTTVPRDIRFSGNKIYLLDSNSRLHYYSIDTLQWQPFNPDLQFIEIVDTGSNASILIEYDAFSSILIQDDLSYQFYPLGSNSSDRYGLSGDGKKIIELPWSDAPVVKIWHVDSGEIEEVELNILGSRRSGSMAVSINKDGNYIAYTPQLSLQFMQSATPKKVFYPLVVANLVTGQSIISSFTEEFSYAGRSSNSKFADDNSLVFTYNNFDGLSYLVGSVNVKSSQFSHSAMLGDLELVSTSPLRVSGTLSSDSDIFSIVRTSMATGKVSEFIHFGAEVDDYRFGLTSGEYQYQITPCNRHLVCDESATQIQQVTVQDFNSPPQINTSFETNTEIGNISSIVLNVDSDETADAYRWSSINYGYNTAEKNNAYQIVEKNQVAKLELGARIDVALIAANCLLNFNGSYSCGANSSPLIIDFPTAQSEQTFNAKLLPDISGLSIHWQAYDKHHYKLYRTGPQGQTPKLLYEGTGSAVIDADLIPGAPQHYRLLSCSDNKCRQEYRMSKYIERVSSPVSVTSKRNALLRITLDITTLYRFSSLRIYREQGENGRGTRSFLAEIAGDATQYIDNSIQAGQEHSYFIEGCYKNKCSEVAVTTTKEQGYYGKYLPSAPTGLNVTPNYFNENLVKWQPVEGAQGYIINVTETSGVSNKYYVKGQGVTEFQHSLNYYLGTTLLYSISSVVGEKDRYSDDYDFMSSPSKTVSVSSIETAFKPLKTPSLKKYSNSVLSWNYTHWHDEVKIYERIEGEEEWTLLRASSRSPYSNGNRYSVSSLHKQQERYEYRIAQCSYNLASCSPPSNIVVIDFNTQIFFDLQYSAPKIEWGVKSEIRERSGIFITPDTNSSGFITYIGVLVTNVESGAQSHTRLNKVSETPAVFLSDYYFRDKEYQLRTNFCINGACSNWSEAALWKPAQTAYQVPSSVDVESNFLDQTQAITQYKITFSQMQVDINRPTEFRVYRGNTSESMMLVETIEAQEFPTAALYTFIDTNLKEPRRVHYMIESCNAIGCRQSTLLLVEEPENKLPDTPKILSVQPTFSQRVRLTFSYADHAQSYEVLWRKKDKGQWSDWRSRSPYISQYPRAYELLDDEFKLAPDDEFEFKVKACNELGCSLESAVVSYSFADYNDFVQQSLVNLEGDAISALTYENIVWKGGPPKAFKGRLDTMSGVIHNKHYLDLSSGGIQTQSFNLNYADIHSCEVLFDSSLTISPDHHELFEILYTGSGCSEHSDLAPYTLYLRSAYIDKPFKLDKSGWLGRWNNLEVMYNPDGHFAVSVNGKEFVVSDTSIDMDFFTSAKFRVQSSKGSALSQLGLVMNAQDSIHSSEFNNSRVGLSGAHPRFNVFERGYSSTTFDHINVWEIQNGNIGAKKTLIENGSSRQVVETSILNSYYIVRICANDHCDGPFYFNKRHADYKVINDVPKPEQNFAVPYISLLTELHEWVFRADADLGKRAGWQGDNFIMQARWQGDSDWADVENKTIEEVLQAEDRLNLSWSPDISSLLQTKNDTQTNLQFRLKICNPLGCATSESVTVSATDSDSDGVLDHLDAFPNDGAESLDTDSDGIGNNADEDDDGDGLPDSFEISIGLDPLISNLIRTDDLDGDGFTDGLEFAIGSALQDASSTPYTEGRLFSFELSQDTDLSIEGGSRHNAQTAHGSWSLLKDSEGGVTEFTVSFVGQLSGGYFGFAYFEPAMADIKVTINGTEVQRDIQHSIGVAPDWSWLAYPVTAGQNEVVISLTGGSVNSAIDAIYFPQKTFVAGDYDGDGKADLGYRNTRTFEVKFLDLIDDQPTKLTFGRDTRAISVNGDFDGDSISDVAVWLAIRGTFYVRRSSDEQLMIKSFGRDGDIPVPADYDGDGITDFAVRRPSDKFWYIYQSSTQTVLKKRFGLDANDIPTPADYDGDGKADIAIRRPSNSTWYILQSSDGVILRKRFGLQIGDIPIPADYDGDGKDDIAVRRPFSSDTAGPLWFILQSSDDSIRRVGFGANSSDIVVPADYDGDGKADIAFTRNESMYDSQGNIVNEGKWYFLLSSNGQVETKEFGGQGEQVPLNAPYILRRKLSQSDFSERFYPSLFEKSGKFEERLKLKDARYFSDPEYLGSDTVIFDETLID
jgi:hypothetical protein